MIIIGGRGTSQVIKKWKGLVNGNHHIGTCTETVDLGGSANHLAHILLPLCYYHV